jgi:hypothetical protein
MFTSTLNYVLEGGFGGIGFFNSFFFPITATLKLTFSKGVVGLADGGLAYFWLPV